MAVSTRSTSKKSKRGQSKKEKPSKMRVRPKDIRPETRRTRAEESMEARLTALDPGTVRYNSLKTAIHFKRSWLALARCLSEVQQSGEFKEWGYRTFEAYAQHELLLKRETAQKLLRSYSFLNQHEPRLLDTVETEEPERSLPSYGALDALREARENPYLAEDDYRELRDRVFTEDPSPGQVRKLIRERAPEPIKQARDDDGDRIRKALALAERLYGLILEEDQVPDRVTTAMEEVVGGLRRLVEE